MEQPLDEKTKRKKLLYKLNNPSGKSSKEPRKSGDRKRKLKSKEIKRLMKNHEVLNNLKEADTI